MLVGSKIRLRPIREEDWQYFEKWGQDREALWGHYQRFQLDHVPALRQAFQQGGLFDRDSGFLLIETLEDSQVVGYIRYTLMKFPDADFPHSEIGFGITEAQARGKGMAKEAVCLLVEYLFAGYAAPRISAITDFENLPCQKLLESAGFKREGVMRRASFRDGEWVDMMLYGLLREEWATR